LFGGSSEEFPTFPDLARGDGFPLPPLNDFPVDDLKEEEIIGCGAVVVNDTSSTSSSTDKPWDKRRLRKDKNPCAIAILVGGVELLLILLKTVLCSIMGAST